MRVKKLVKVGLSEGGGVQPDFRLKRGGGGGGGLIMNVIVKKIFCVSMRILNLFQDLFYLFLV